MFQESRDATNRASAILQNLSQSSKPRANHKGSDKHEPIDVMAAAEAENRFGTVAAKSNNGRPVVPKLSLPPKTLHDKLNSMVSQRVKVRHHRVLLAR